MKLAALIPARGGSKRFPGKNLALLNGLSLLAHSIRYAKSSDGLIDSIWVSTDDAAIAQVAKDEGAQVIIRPNELATDFATSAAVAKHSLDVMPNELDGVVLLQPTNPLRPDGLLLSAVQLFGSRKFDSVYSVSPLHRKAGFIENERFLPLNFEFGERSQDMKQMFFENGLVYISSIETILQNKIIGPAHATLVVDHPYGEVDIDTKDDLDYAAFLMNKFLVR